MDSINKAMKTQLENIQSKTGKTLDELRKIAMNNGLEKHGHIRKFMIEQFELGYGDANLIATYTRNPEDPAFQDPQEIDTDQLIAQIYNGPKEKFFSLHQKLMDEIKSFGEFTISPKKSNVSLRRKRQFILLGPATNSRFEVGLNLKRDIKDERLKPQPQGSMCDYVIVVNSEEDINPQLVNWMRMAFEDAG